MKPEYKPDTCVVYDTYGICKVNKIDNISFSKGTPKRPYYILSPLNSPSSTYYVPITNEALQNKLRLPMTEPEIKDLLKRSQSHSVKWIENRQERNEAFSRILSHGITEELICLVGCLYKRRLDLSKRGKKLSSTDEGFFSAAEKMLREEFAFSLEISPDEVTEYIHTFMSEAQGQDHFL